MILLIICKGTKEGSELKKCDFLYDGNWGDEQLQEHQKFHESRLNDISCWLGFDTPQSFGEFSGRDGKRN